MLFNINTTCSLKIKAINLPGINEKDSITDTSSFGLRQQIKVIGLYKPNEKDPEKSYIIFYNEDEKELLKTFWNFINDPENNIYALTTWAGKSYDFPMLYQRTIINKVPITNMHFPLISELNYNNEKLIDAANFWKCGGSKIDSLFNVANALGFFKSPDEINTFKLMAENYKSFYPLFIAEVSNKKEGIATKFLKDQLKFVYDITDYLI